MTEIQNQSTASNEQRWKTIAAILGVLFVIASIFGITFYNKYKQTDSKATDLGTQLDSTRAKLQADLAALNINYTDQIALNAARPGWSSLTFAR